MRLHSGKTLSTAVLIAVELFRCGFGLDAPDYADALSKSILFFEGQRSGQLPENQRMSWRWHSGLNDRWNDVDLTGGYYDAGDNVKFGFPMAFSVTMLAWSVVDFGSSMPHSDLQNALTAIRWGTDYLLKTVSRPNTIFVQVGDPKKDHNCWERPEDMDTDRTVYYLEAPKPASEIAGETAAALSSSSIAFRTSDPQYSGKLLDAARSVFSYADSYRGHYHDDPFVNSGSCPFYCDYNGYKDELLWGAAWLWRASEDSYYINYVQTEGQTLSDGESSGEFGWDNKYGGVNVLLAREYLLERIGSMQGYKDLADSFMCDLQSGEYTSGGLIYKPGGSNLQHATAISFLLTSYAGYLENSGDMANCRGGALSPVMLRQRAKSQIDYILGRNPNSMSYMVGFGMRFPRRVHHRGSSIPSIRIHPSFVACKEGTVYFASPDPNPNELTGAVVGGPGDTDSYEDDRADAVKSEPTTYINAAIVGPLAYFAAHRLG